MKIQKIRHRTTGAIVFGGAFETLRHAATQAVADNVCLDGADFSGANLVNAALDGTRLQGACFQDANLLGANLTEAVLDGADFTNANLQAACLRNASLRGCIFDGTQFGATDIGGCNIGGSLFSTPSAFFLNFTDTANMKDCYYSHSSREACMMSRPPVVVHGLPVPVVFMDDHVMMGTKLYPCADFLSGTNDNGFHDNLSNKLDINFI